MAERFIPKAQEIYRHIKGDLYQVLAVAKHTETGEQLVIYQALYGDFEIYARPLELFVSPVDRAIYPDAAQEFCFQLQGPEAGRQQAVSRPGGMAAADQGQADARGGQANSPDTVKAQPDIDESGLAGKAAEGRTITVKPEPETQTGTAQPEPEEPGLDPLVLEFLDARTYEQRLNVLAALHHRITNEMITTMALCCDIEVDGDDVEQRYEDLKQCLITKDRFEIKRLV